MKFFITGGAGFIGSTLTKFLLKKGHKVTIFDNFNNSSEAISDLIEDGAKSIKGDVTNYDSLAKALSEFDVAVHLAAKINVQESIQNPAETRNVNVDGTVNLLRACVENKIKKIIAVSTAAVFGIPKELPLSENSSTSPVSPYAKSKLAMEQYIREFYLLNIDSYIFEKKLINYDWILRSFERIENDGDISKMCLSFEKAKKIIGFEPKMKVKDGVADYLAWLKIQTVEKKHD